MKSLIFILFALIVSTSFAKPNLRDQNFYVGEIDRNLTIQKITVLPFKDNVGGTYAKALETKTQEEISNNHKWDLVPARLAGSVPLPSKLELNPELLAPLSQNIKTDAFIIADIVNTPKGINLKLDLFLSADNKLILQSKENRIEDFSIKGVTEKYKSLLKEFFAKLPYEGMILSRSKNKVTLNLGSKDNIKVGQVLSASQIVSLNRHPKFNFLINSSKEVLGQIKIYKVDKYLSFGNILNEKERGSVQKYSKITGANRIEYIKNSGGSYLADAPQGGVIYGKDPKAWRPSRTPTFGSFGVNIGNALHRETAGGTGASPNFTPNLTLDGEIWINPNWSAHVELMHGFTSVDDSDFRISSHDILIGRKFNALRGTHGPYLEVFGGFSGFKARVSGTNVLGFQSATYKALRLGVGGETPLSSFAKWSIGGDFSIYLNPSISTPGISGNSDGSATHFGIYGKYMFNSRVNFMANLDVDNYSTSNPNLDTSQRSVNISGGINYLF